MDFKIVKFNYFNEDHSHHAVVLGRNVVELPHGVAPIRRVVAPYVERLKQGEVGRMARIFDGKWTAFEIGRLI
jgi:hypothetical protein